MSPEASYEQYQRAFALPPNVARRSAFMAGWRAALVDLADHKLIDQIGRAHV